MNTSLKYSSNMQNMWKIKVWVGSVLNRKKIISKLNNFSIIFLFLVKNTMAKYTTTSKIDKQSNWKDLDLILTHIT